MQEGQEEEIEEEKEVIRFPAFSYLCQFSLFNWYLPVELAESL